MATAENVLGIEGGGTKTAWILVRFAEEKCEVVDRGKLPGANLRLSSPDKLRAIFSAAPQSADRVGVFLAGCVTAEDAATLRAIAKSVWRYAHLVVGSDRDSGMAAALEDGDGVVVNAGTGASVTGRRGERIEKAGGWGHVLGDTGGGYFLSIRALRLILQEYDVHRGELQFAAQILRALCLNTLDELVRWAQAAEKMEVAMLAREVFIAARNGDTNAVEIINEGARVLAQYTSAVARRLELHETRVRLIGGLFNERIYVAAFERELQDLIAADVRIAEQAPEFGAVWLARQKAAVIHLSPVAPLTSENISTAATEQSNPHSAHLDELSARELVNLFAAEERSVQEAIAQCASPLAEAIEIVTFALKNGGRLFYVGAGTSGRLGVLDASEIPPTFGAATDLVQAIIAGGAAALHRSVEGAEDDRGAGAFALSERGVKETDVVIGITASGRTPFVFGALERAKSVGAKTALLTCNPNRVRPVKFDIEIDLPTGPEIVTGSTRLKAGTATKVALNIISTGAMIQLGKVRGNLMVDLQTTNAKLRDRAIRIVAQATGCDEASARARLQESSWNVRAAIESSP